MMKKLKYGCFGIFVLAAVGFVACDKTETGMDEWTDIAYVYVKGQTLGNRLVKDITIVETEGVQNPTPIDYKFLICLNRVAMQDVTVALEPAVTGYVAGIKDNTMTLSAKSARIPAGRLVSDTVTLTVDPAFLGVVDAQGEYAPSVFTVKMKNLQTAAEDVKSTTKTDKIVITLNKKVKAYLNIASKAAAGAVNMDRSGWTGTLGEGVEGSIEKIFDGSTGSDIAANKTPWEFTIDVGSATKMLGVRTRHWGTGYAPNKIEVRTSVDNSTWKSQGIFTTSGATQDWHFITPVTARYMKYILMAPNQRLDVTEFYITVPQQ